MERGSQNFVHWMALLLVEHCLHRDIPKLTWTSPNGDDCNQIDHIIVNGRYRSLLNARVMRGADANNNNHHLVMVRVKLKLWRGKKERKAGRKLYVTMNLRDQNMSRKSAILRSKTDLEHWPTIRMTTHTQDWLKLTKVYCECRRCSQGKEKD